MEKDPAPLEHPSASTGADPFPSILEHPVVFSPIRRAIAGAWLGHIPFARLLIDVHRPRTIVELGTARGLSFCCFCQAVEELGLNARCYAVDTWMGDEHVGLYGEQVYADLRAHHDPLYGGFSELIRATFDEALGRFQDATIDLLHIDGLHTYEAVRHDFDTWLPKLSDRGIVLFHDIAPRRREGFGVFKLWEEVSARWPSFAFEHSSGLGVLAVGARATENLSFLFDAVDRGRIRQFFSFVGEALQRAETAREAEHELRAMKTSRAYRFLEPMRALRRKLQSS